MSNYKYHQLVDIDWTKVRVVSLSQEDFGNFYKYIRQERVQLDKYHSREVFNYIDEDTYYIEWVDNRFFIKLKIDDELRIYTTNWYDDDKNKKHINGAKIINDLFESKYGLDLRKAFGYTNEEFKNCIPKAIHYVNNLKKSYSKDNYLILKASGVDFCSQYPSNLTGDLPDYKRSIKLKGTIKPTKEYPFAFYVKSGFIAEYNKYDTHDWINSELKNYLFYTKDDVRIPDGVSTLDQKLYYINNPDEDETVLMPSSQYNLTEIYTELYEKRNEDNEYYKGVLNKSIGSFHTRKYKSYKLAHIAAIGITRANKQILDLVQQIGLKNIIQICVDGIIYQGSIKYGEDTKGLNKLCQEFINCDVIITSENRYIVSKYNEVIKYKHSGVNYDTKQKVLIDDSYKPTSLFSIFDWVKSDPLEVFKTDIIK